MAQIPYRANLSAATFPLTLARAGRSVIIPGPDNTFDKRVDPEGTQKDAGIPQIIYGEDILPTVHGYQSVGYTSQDDIPIPGGDAIEQVVEIFSAISATLIQKVRIVSYTLGSALQSSRFDTLNVWGPINWIGGAQTTAPNSSAVVNGVCYVFFPVTGQLYTAQGGGAGQLTLNNVTAGVTPVGFFAPLDKIGITGAFNYLVTCTKTTVYWSSTTSPVDFTVSLVTGAGSSGINSTFSLLEHIEPHPVGFYLYTGSNVIAAKYTGNRLYPWQFSPIKNSRSAANRYGYTLSADYHVGIENDGTVKLISPAEAIPVAPEMIQLFDRSTSRIDLFDYTTNLFSLFTVPTVGSSRVTVTGRYICISYGHTGLIAFGYTQFTKVLIFDTVLRRYGKLNITHTHTFAIGSSVETIGLINAPTGKTFYVAKDMYNTLTSFGVNIPHKGVLVLGRIQYVRSRFLCLDEFDVEATQDTGVVTPNFSVIVLPSLDGKAFGTPITPSLVSHSGNLARYRTLAEGKNVSLVIKGAFDLSSIDMKFHVGGAW